MPKLYISMYHYTRDLNHSRYPAIKGLDIPLFKKQMEFFKENFNVVRMEQVIDAVKGQSDLHKNTLLFAIDDGYTESFTYALYALDEFGFQGLSFANEIHQQRINPSIHNFILQHIHPLFVAYHHL